MHCFYLHHFINTNQNDEFNHHGIVISIEKCRIYPVLGTVFHLQLKKAVIETVNDSAIFHHRPGKAE